MTFLVPSRHVAQRENVRDGSRMIPHWAVSVEVPCLLLHHCTRVAHDSHFPLHFGHILHQLLVIKDVHRGHSVQADTAFWYHIGSLTVEGVSHYSLDPLPSLVDDVTGVFSGSACSATVHLAVHQFHTLRLIVLSGFVCRA